MKYILFFLLLASSTLSAQTKETMIRLSEIEVDSACVKEYIAILQKDFIASVLFEPGVIAIYTMYQKENPTQIRILEIYENKKPY